MVLSLSPAAERKAVRTGVSEAAHFPERPQPDAGRAGDRVPAAAGVGAAARHRRPLAGTSALSDSPRCGARRRGRQAWHRGLRTMLQRPGGPHRAQPGDRHLPTLFSRKAAPTLLKRHRWCVGWFPWLLTLSRGLPGLLS